MGLLDKLFKKILTPETKKVDQPMPEPLVIEKSVTPPTPSPPMVEK